MGDENNRIKIDFPNRENLISQLHSKSWNRIYKLNTPSKTLTLFS
jgi:hypothetical protein